MSTDLESGFNTPNISLVKDNKFIDEKLASSFVTDNPEIGESNYMELQKNIDYNSPVKTKVNNFGKSPIIQSCKSIFLKC